MNEKLIAAAQSIRKKVFLGGVIDRFEKEGRDQFIQLLRHGLNPDSKLLDIGCGCLRGGYWTIRFLDQGGYFGVEPNKDMLDAGKEAIIGRESLSDKRPRFDNGDQYDFSVFNEEVFDFFMACSIWTHAPKEDIRKMLHQFYILGRSNSVFLSSFIRTKDHAKDYEGTEWIGKSHTSSQAGLVMHRLESLQEIASEFDLTLSHIQPNRIGTISWLKITKLDSSAGREGERIN